MRSRTVKVAQPSGSWVIVTLLFVMVGLLAVAFYYSLQQQNKAISLLEPVPNEIWLPVPDRRSTLVDNVEIELTISVGDTVRAPEWTGIVTSPSESASGSVLKTGDVLLQVDGVDRVLAFADAPFFRPIGWGQEGGDVEALAELLQRLGLLDASIETEGVVFGNRMSAAVREFGKRIGADIPEANRSVVFDPAWVVFLPSEPFLAGRILDLPTGSPVPSLGDPVVFGTPTVSKASIVDYEQPPGATDAVVLLDNGSTFRVDLGTGELVDPSSAVALLAVNETDVEASDSLSLIASLSVSWADEILAVPTSSLIILDDGRICIVTPEVEVEVEVLGSQIESGVTYIRTAGADGISEVLANPRSARPGDRFCSDQ